MSLTNAVERALFARDFLENSVEGMPEWKALDGAGEVRPPFRWEPDRRRLRAKLDALYFHLYGVTGRDDISYVYSTFPIVEKQERRAWGS